MKSVLLASLLALTPPAASAQSAATLREQVEAKLGEAGTGVRFGLVVATADGRELLAINPDGRFVPASNTKLFTTIAAYELLPGLEQPDAAGGASVRLVQQGSAPPDVILRGGGDARLSSAPDCRSNCLSTLADSVAARTRKVRRVVGDATAFADERWSFGMSWNNIPTRSGTGLAALMVDSNELALRVRPGAPGQPPEVEVAGDVEVANEARTVAEGATQLEVTRLPGSARLRLSGTVAAGAGEQLLRLGIDDPALHAAFRLTQMLKARGVTVAGRPAAAYANKASDRLPGLEVARVTPAPLGQDIVTVNKVSQNVHAEMLLRRLGAARGKPSVAGGLEAVRAVLDRAGVSERAATLADGSGMSPYNRASPRGIVTLLRWAAGRPWGASLRTSLPIGGVDGTLARRFAQGPLKGRIFAKTGSLTAANALSGYLLTRSGETLVFSIIANDVPDDLRATAIMDEALELIAASH